MYELSISNYQIIKDMTLPIKPGLTLITGHSNNGKSSIFKAFKQLVYNTSGTDYIRHGTTKTSITLRHSLNGTDVYYIEYTKTPNSSQYKTQTTDGTQIYSKLGSSQPEFIKELTHIDKEFNYNFWSQMDKPFLISQSPKEQFDYLQQSPHTEVLQSILQSMQSDKKVYSQKSIQNQAQLEMIQQQNQQFTHQLESLPQLSQLFTNITQLKSQADTLKEITSLLTKFNQINLTPLEDKLNKLRQLPNLDHLTTQYQTLQDLNLQFTNLTKTQYPINQLKQTILQSHTLYDQTKLFLETNFPVCPLCNQPFHTH